MEAENSTLKAFAVYGVCFILALLTPALFPSSRAWILILILQVSFLALPLSLGFTGIKATPRMLKKPEIKDTLLVILITICYAPLASLITSLIGQLLPGFTEHLHRTHQMVLPGGMGIGEPAVFLILALLPAICEEFFFRGFLMNRLENGGISSATVLLVPAFLFALIHRDPYNFVALFLYGIILGIIMLATRSLWLVAFSHLLNNSLSLLVLRLNSGNPTNLMPGSPSLLTIFLMLLPLTLLLIVLTHLLKRHRDRQHIL